MTKIDHPDISPIIKIWENKLKNSIIFITNFYAGGSIREYLSKVGVQKLKIIKQWMKMIISGLEYLHHHNIIFKDLNCGRIFYNSNNGNIYIGDVFVSSEIFYQLFSEKVYGNMIT